MLILTCIGREVTAGVNQEIAIRASAVTLLPGT